MKHTFKLLASISLLAAIAFSIAACDDGTTSGGGTFTLTDIPAEYNGKYAFFCAGAKNGSYGSAPFGILYGLQELSDWWTLVQIKNGKAVFKLYYIDSGYEGNDTYEDVSIYIHENRIVKEPFSGIEHNLLQVTFSNGSATKSWNDDGSSGGDGWLSNISSSLAGKWYLVRQEYGPELFSITADGTGSIKGQGGYTVQERYNPREAKFMQGSNVIGQFTFSFNADGWIWLRSATGPFAEWVILETETDRLYVISKRK